MPAFKMLLHPADPDCKADRGKLAIALQDIGLLAAARPLGDDHYYPAGDRFLDLITFLGCAPTIELDPPEDPVLLARASAAGQFCHAFITCSAQPRLRADARTPPPRCPGCKQPLADWTRLLAAWRQRLPEAPWKCGSCGRDIGITSLPFRKTAGIASIWLEIRGIYPSEAVPGHALLMRLETLTSCPWRTLYLRE